MIKQIAQYCRDHLSHTAPFVCAGCDLPSWKTVCETCKQSLQFNTELLPAPTSELESVAPLLFSYTRTHSLIRNWKSNGGADISRALFRLDHRLEKKLIEIHPFAIVAIPQNHDRNYERGHASALETARFFSKRLHIPILPLLKLKSQSQDRLSNMKRFEREWAENPFSFDHHGLKTNKYYQLWIDKFCSRQEIRLILIDDIITSGSTLAKAASEIKLYSPKIKIWGASIGFRPRTGVRSIHGSSSSSN